MLHKDTLELIQKTAQVAVKPAVLDVPGDGRTFLIFDGTKIECHTNPPPLRKHVVHSLNDLISYVTADPVEGETKNPVVWHGESGVIAVLNDADRLETVTFRLSYGEKFKVLQWLAREKPFFDQKEFIKLLRFRLGLDNTLVVAQFRKLQWEAGATINAQVNRGDARLGKNIIEKVEGVDQLPEELNVPSPVYAQSGERDEYLVRCGIEIDATNQVFQLIPLPDELPRVMDLAQASIHTRLEGALECPVYYGVPK